MTTIERIARAICAAHYQDPDEHLGTSVYGANRVFRWMNYESDARAAIMALADGITEEMIIEFQRMAYQGDPTYDNTTLHCIHEGIRSAINVALAPKPQ